MSITGWSATDQEYMRAAMGEARAAAGRNEVPVGAVVVRDGDVLARGGNRTLSDIDPTAHAEVVAIRSAARTVGNHRLTGATVYVTLEPCPMCVGAMREARIARVVFGAYDKRAGALGSVTDLGRLRETNHRMEVNGGLFADEAGDLLGRFFEARRGSGA